jgi:signal transduction histidine kinase
MSYLMSVGKLYEILPMRPVGILSPLPQSSVLTRYTVALASAVFAIALRAALEPVLGHAGFYVTVYIAVVFSALVCGLGPSILSALLATAGIVYWFVDPRHSIVIGDKRDIHALIACLLVCPVLIVLGEANRRKRLEITRARDELDQRVRDRTAELSQALAKLESEVKERRLAEEQLRGLSLRLMTVQDEERRHMARDLHDTAGQTLAAIKMSLALLQQNGPYPEHTLKLLDDVSVLTDEALQEIRTTSYLLHPPLLDECGFASAARWFVEGFTKRSGIQVQCEFPDQTERLPQHVELVLFRMLQEALTNVHRHAGATAACITLQRDANGIKFQVRDNGSGIPEQRLKRLRESHAGSGVGLAGMRERVRELGGEMAIQSGNSGTTISFDFSLEKASGASGTSSAT